MRPPVTVVIPTFNRAAQLREALDSLAGQTFRRFDTIVVDDGSTEDIHAAVADHPVRPAVIRQSRRGPGAARNRGVAAAESEWIAFLDSDDLWLPAKLERFLAAAAAEPQIAIWYGPMRPIDAQRRPVEGRTKSCHPGRITDALFQSSFVHVPTVVCRRQTLAEFGGFDESLPVCEDYDLWLRISVREPFGLVPEPLALRRLHPDRLSKSCMRRNLAVKLHVMERFYYSPDAAGILDHDTARRRLARVAYAAARAALRGAWFRAAHDAFCRAQRYGASGARLRFLLGLTALLRIVGRDCHDLSPAFDAAPASDAAPACHTPPTCNPAGVRAVPPVGLPRPAK